MNNMLEKRYRAYCKDHDWEGMSQVESEDAKKDLKAHIEQYPNENHDNSGVLESEV